MGTIFQSSYLGLISVQASHRMKTPAKYMTGTTVLPFNPAAFGEVGLAFISVLLSLKMINENVTPKEMSMNFLCSR